jgi:hypothetical protein
MRSVHLDVYAVPAVLRGIAGILCVFWSFNMGHHCAIVHSLSSSPKCQP